MTRRFKATSRTIYRDLRSIMIKMDATSLRVNQDLYTGDVEIVFDRSTKRYVFSCDKYDDPLDNLRAAQLTITYLWRALEQYGVVQEAHALEAAFEQFFLGFAATPDDTVLLLGEGQDEWWEVLGVTADADRRGIKNAYRALAKTHHPDSGGDADDFRRLRAAYDQAMDGLS